VAPAAQIALDPIAIPRPAGEFTRHPGVFRLIDFAALAALLIRFRSVLRWFAIRPLIMLGQASLHGHPRWSITDPWRLISEEDRAVIYNARFHSSSCRELIGGRVYSPGAACGSAAIPLQQSPSTIRAKERTHS
jgi:hypothetical protein